MMQIFINSALILLTLLFTQLTHPLSMGFILLIQTLMICIYTGMMYETFWFSYILFLVFLGGMLVLFIYITALASNEMFNFSMKLLLIFFSALFMMFVLSLLTDKIQFIFINNYEMNNIFYYSEIKENYLMINKLYNYPTNMITLMLINYLFFTLIVIVKITNFFYGPLRNLN
nr:TPA_asm: NADH dehydrogenase subunit 6 [Trichosia splendens]